ncbi:glycoside hydrolase family 43 protein [Flagellimonas sp. 389]|uniref:glycoside hydrolase family 43 protein n=1 Tax=Flagellimonas sp. 389 TaxID=2835862 RepID=UPI001BD2FC60|nr:glycoside hydrolase family 43 protein [Flagellimonas sp. 389]MBS9462589.1 glycoside hydrolase family 43 protein [Flagellimonas sp. 389]
MTYYRFFLLIIFLSISVKINAQQEVKTGNPILKEWYADPEIVIFDNTYWIFPTFSGIVKKQDFMDAFSSKDLVNWKKHENIVTPKNVAWINNELWAPSAIEKDGKYFVFFSANDIQTPDSHWWDPQKHDSTEVGGIGVAVSRKPQGPYTDHIGKPLIGKVLNKAQPIDQFVFKAKDGIYYIVYGGWGRCNIGKLNDDFTDLVPFEDGQLVKEITPENYVEGPLMFYREEKYYMMWSEGSWGKDSYKVAYGVADRPFGPFDRIATILESDPNIATGAGHNSVLHMPDTDDWYIVYHRRPIPNEHRNHRVVCIDKMEFNDDGTIKPIKMTFEGVGAVPLISNGKK